MVVTTRLQTLLVYGHLECTAPGAPEKRLHGANTRQRRLPYHSNI